MLKNCRNPLNHKETKEKVHDNLNLTLDSRKMILTSFQSLDIFLVSLHVPTCTLIKYVPEERPPEDKFTRIEDRSLLKL